MSQQLPALSTPKPVQKPRISKRLRLAIDLWLTGKAGTRKDAAAKAKLSETYFCKALKKPAVQSFLRARAEQNITDATLRASSRVGELLDGSSEHVAGKVALRLLESEKLIAPAGGAAAVNINHFGNGPIGFCVDWRTDRDPEEAARPLKPEKQAEYDAWLRGEGVGCVIGPGDLMPIDVTPERDDS
jgi:hypothetical protein